MELLKEIIQLLEPLPQAAFLVKDGTIVYANHNARARGVQQDTDVDNLICIGIVEYKHFVSGKLMLTTAIADIYYNTVVSVMGTYHLFRLESELSDPELHALSLAAQVLREPLSASMMRITELLPKDAIQDSPELLEQVEIINKNLNQLFRTVRNMADADTAASSCTKELRDVAGLVSEWVEKANTLMEGTGHHIVLTSLKCPVFCEVNPEKLERAFLNLISNAVKYADKPDTIKVSLSMHTGRLYLSVESACSNPQAIFNNSLFTRFSREPSLSDYQSGIGLGLIIARGIAVAHKGTLLIDQPNDDRIRFTLSISMRSSGMLTMNSPTIRVVNNGGHDQFLIELADVLPPELYK